MSSVKKEEPAAAATVTDSEQNILGDISAPSITDKSEIVKYDVIVALEAQMKCYYEKLEMLEKEKGFLEIQQLNIQTSIDNINEFLVSIGAKAVMG